MLESYYLAKYLENELKIRKYRVYKHFFSNELAIRNVMISCFSTQFSKYGIRIYFGDKSTLFYADHKERILGYVISQLILIFSY